MRLYDELASWWPLVSPPADYAQGAAIYRSILGNARTVLELGSGGGNNASHLKRSFEMTLLDRSPGMLAVSRALNPECEHVEGDMRWARLERQFDAVLLQDAVMYLISEEELGLAFATAYAHLRPGGMFLVAPDWVRETFQPLTESGGTDGEGRGLRYLEWVYDPDPSDNTCRTEMAILLREADGTVRVVHDSYVLGLFGRGQWLRVLTESGFDARPEPAAGDAFVGVKRA